MSLGCGYISEVPREGEGEVGVADEKVILFANVVL